MTMHALGAPALDGSHLFSLPHVICPQLLALRRQEKLMALDAEAFGVGS